MNIEILRNIEQLDRGHWNALAQKNAVNTIYQTYEWNHASEQIYGRPDGSYILCVKDKGVLIAILPLMFSVTEKKRTLQFMAGHRSDYCDMICPDRQEEILALIWDFILSRRKEWDLIRLNNVPLSTSFARYIKKNKILKGLSHRSSQNEAVHLNFQDEAFTKRVLSKKRVHDYRNHLKKNGQYDMLHLIKPADIGPFLEDFFAQHIERWQKTLFPSLFLDEKNKQFYRHIVRILPPGWITFSVLKWKGKVLGYHLGFSYGKRFIWYKPTFNVSFGRYSPGQVLLQEVMEYAHAKGFEEFDLGVGKEEYKYRFSNRVSSNNSFKVYPSRGEYLCYYIPLMVRWRLQKFFIKTTE
jgi:CelD/BcsL family acetyltransferase involved in cellulose biosynthesis